MTPSQLRVLNTVIETEQRRASEGAVLKLLQQKLPKILDTAEPELLRLFFTHIEVHAPASLARKIAVHELRPAEVTALVEARKAENAVQKAEQPKSKPKNDGAAE